MTSENSTEHGRRFVADSEHNTPNREEALYSPRISPRATSLRAIATLALFLAAASLCHAPRAVVGEEPARHLVSAERIIALRGGGYFPVMIKGSSD